MLDQETQQLAKDLYKFMKNKFGFQTKPKIKFIYSKSNAHNKLGMTGHYDPESEEIAIFCADRHPKDILRSLAHELMHHVQKHEGSFNEQSATPEGDPNYIVHNKFLEDIEADAFERGNIAFRFWEAGKKMKSKNEQFGMSDQDKLLNQEGNLMDEVESCSEENINEKKKKKRKLSKVKLKKAKKMAASMEKKQGYSAEKAHKIAYAAVQKEGQEMVRENKQPEVKPVEVNEALKDSVVYNKDDRACNDLYNNREETVFQDLLKKFGIKK